MTAYHRWCHDQLSGMPGIFELRALSRDCFLLTWPDGNGNAELLDGYARFRCELSEEIARELLLGNVSEAFVSGLSWGLRNPYRASK